MTPALVEIEARRVQLGISKQALERAANLPNSYYSSFIMAGTRAPRPSLLARLKLALQRWKLRQTCDNDRDFAVAIAYRMAIAMAAGALDADPRAVQGQDPARRATQDPEWMKGAAVRRLAVYLMNVGAGFSQTDTARAAGLTKQAVSQAVRDLEDRRSDIAFDTMLERMTTAIMGEW